MTVAISAGKTHPIIPCSDFNRRLTGYRSAISQLTMQIITPRPQCAIGLQAHAMQVATADTNPCMIGTDLYRAKSLQYGAVTQLSVRIPSPAPKCAIRFHSQAMQIASSYAYPCCICTHLKGRNGATGTCAITQLAFGIVSPGPERSI